MILRAFLQKSDFYLKGDIMTKYKINKINLLFGIIFGVVGVVMLCIIIGQLIKWNDFKKTALPAEAVITNIETVVTRDSDGDRTTKHYVDIEYYADGKTYSGPLGYYSSGMREGDTITVYYDPDNPGYTMSKPYLMCGIMSIFLLVFGGIGAGFLIYEIRMYNFASSLIREDKYVYSEDWHEEIANVRVNNVRYRMAVCTYHDSYGREYTFNSQPYHPNKCPFYPGKQIKIYVDIEKDGTKYYVSEDE